MTEMYKNMGVKQFLNTVTVEAFFFRWQIEHFVSISCLLPDLI